MLLRRVCPAWAGRYEPRFHAPEASIQICARRRHIITARASCGAWLAFGVVERGMLEVEDVTGTNMKVPFAPLVLMSSLFSAYEGIPETVVANERGEARTQQGFQGSVRRLPSAGAYSRC
eukprot:6174144-Pleurochrysis_carterae.AAC.2